MRLKDLLEWLHSENPSGSGDGAQNQQERIAFLGLCMMADSETLELINSEPPINLRDVAARMASDPEFREQVRSRYMVFAGAGLSHYSSLIDLSGKGDPEFGYAAHRYLDHMPEQPRLMGEASPNPEDSPDARLKDFE